MATYTIDYVSKCAGGGHYTFAIKRGTNAIKRFTISVSELETVDIDAYEMAMMLIRVALKQANPNTMAEARTAIENISVTI